MGEDIEKSELLCITEGNVKRCSHCGKWYSDSSKTETKYYHINQQFHFLDIHPNELKVLDSNIYLLSMTMAALFTTIKSH